VNKTVQEIIEAFNELSPENKVAFLEFVRNNFDVKSDNLIIYSHLNNKVKIRELMN
jgi:hypothetical protein